MRVTDGAARPRDAGAGTARARAFGEVMRRAREAGVAGARGEAARGSGVRTAVVRRTVADGKDAALGARRDGAREEERGAALRSADVAARAVALAAEPAGPAELRAALRALPVAIDASRVRDGAPLSLSLGRALDVDLRAARSGVELVLRPDARLARAAEAELPALVASLRARGIPVARAEVRARGPGAAPARRVDVSSPLR